MHKPIISITLAYIGGLLLGHGFLYFPLSISILVLLVILTAGISVWLERLALRRSLLFILPGLVGITAYLYSAAWFPADHYIRRTTLDKASHEITGKIVSALDRDPDRTAFVMETHTIDARPVTGKVRVSIREGSTSLGYGDRVRVSGRMHGIRSFQNPGGFDYAAYLAQRGIYRTVSLKNADSIEVLSRGRGVFRSVQDRRERIRQAFLASTTGPGSAILQAMVLGEEGGLTEEIRDQFMAAGVTHIISIDGSHLGMVAVLCFGLIRWLLFLMPERLYLRLTLFADPKKMAAWLTLPLVLFYTLLAGGQVATVRSFIMITAGLAALVFDRDHALMYSLALAALVILAADPQALFDIAFQLSYLSVMIIGYVAVLWNDMAIEGRGLLRKLRNNVLLLVTISLATSLATGPLVSFYFNQFSLAGIVSNLIVVPLAGIAVVPLGLFSGILSLFTHHLPLSVLNQLAADVFVGTVDFFSRLPFAEFHPPAPGILWLVCYALFFLSCLHVLRAKLLLRTKPLEVSSRISLTPKLAIAVAGAFLMISPALSLLPKHQTLISFPDVGQGDCALLELAAGKTILIDGGGARDNRFDIGRRVVAPFLWSRGIRKLDLVILSHPHPDHLNGMLFVLRKFRVDGFWSHGLDEDLPGQEQLRRLIAQKNICHRIVSVESPVYDLGDAELRVLHPARTFVAHTRKKYAAENDRSLVVKVTDRDTGRVFLFPGDIGKDAENYLISTGQDLRCDLLKVPHHGSKSSSNESFVARAKPSIAVATVGGENPFHHPSGEVVERYHRHGALLFRTDADGAVLIKAGQNGLDAVGWRELMLHRNGLADLSTWREQEQLNWKRIWIRKWEL
jgi:competence protein ComEC